MAETDNQLKLTMASNQLLNEQNDIDGDAKVALLTGITGQVNKIWEDSSVDCL